MKNQIWKLIIALVCSQGLKVFFFPKTGGSFGIVLDGAMALIVLGFFYIPWTLDFSWIKVVRDAVIIVAVNAAALAILPLCIEMTFEDTMIISIFVMLSVVCCFTVTGLMTYERRLAHLAYVAIAIWLIGGLQIVLDTSRLKSWLLSLFMLFLGMWIGYWISWIFKKPSVMSDSAGEQ